MLESITINKKNTLKNQEQVKLSQEYEFKEVLWRCIYKENEKGNI